MGNGCRDLLIRASLHGYTVCKTETEFVQFQYNRNSPHFYSSEIIPWAPWWIFQRHSLNVGWLFFHLGLFSIQVCFYCSRKRRNQSSNLLLKTGSVLLCGLLSRYAFIALLCLYMFPDTFQILLHSDSNS